MNRLDLIVGGSALAASLLCWVAIAAWLGWPLVLVAIAGAAFLLAALWGAGKGWR